MPVVSQKQYAWNVKGYFPRKHSQKHAISFPSAELTYRVVKDEQSNVKTFIFMLTSEGSFSKLPITQIALEYIE